MPENSIRARHLSYRVLALAGSFETGKMPPACFSAMAGDFDGQGISLGALQWNFGQDSLQPLLKSMFTEHRPEMEGIFGKYCTELEKILTGDKESQLPWARSIQSLVSHRLKEPWRKMFLALGQAESFQEIQTQSAAGLYRRALRLSGKYGLWSERGVALMFDIVVQNGGIGRAGQKIRLEIAALGEKLTRTRRETAIMRIIAERRSEICKPRWVDDVRARKLCIACGKGTVHGIKYDLKNQFGICLKAI